MGGVEREKKRRGEESEESRESRDSELSGESGDSREEVNRREGRRQTGEVEGG